MSDPSSPPRVLDLAFLGARLRLVTDGEALIDRLVADLGAFQGAGAAASDAAEPVVEVRFGPPSPQATDGQWTVALDPDVAVDQAFGLVFRELLDRVERYAVLHAAAMERDGKAWLVAGPTWSGKTTLTLALLARGLRLMSDDFTPLDRATGLVAPFPKALGVRPGISAELALSAFGHAVPGLRAPLAAAQLGVDRVVREPLPVGGVVLMNGSENPPSPRDPYPFYVLVAGVGEPLASRLSAIDGVRLIEQRAGLLLIEVDPQRKAVAPLERALDDAAAQVLEYGAVGRPPAPNRTPRLTPLATGDALLLLLREVQNRRPGGALMRRTTGGLAGLLTEIAPAFASARCAWLSAGDLDASADLVERFTRGE